MVNYDTINLLLIEDNEVDAELFTTMLGKISASSFNIVRAETLLEALRLLGKSSAFHAVLLDLSLPDTDGIDSLRAICAECPALPIVVLTGMQNDNIARDALQRGAQDYLIKGEGDGRVIERAIRYAIERKAAERDLFQRANFDALTGLLTRSMFEARVKRAIARAERTGCCYGLMFLDLDGFKQVNDTLGHEAGDQLLIEVSKRLGACLRETDTLARFGGDEFTILLEHLNTPEENECARVAERIVEALNKPITIGDKQVTVSISIGIAASTHCGKNADTLLYDADRAMYEAKRNHTHYAFAHSERAA